jgi:uncharacterized protein GlcG (DUF336 family)
MMLTLDLARKIIADALIHARTLGLKPLGVAVLDAGGHVIAFERQDGASNLRFKIAFGKANGALAVGVGSRKLFQRAQEQPYFINAVNALADGALVPVPGGVLIRSSSAQILGAVGITGDSSDNDEQCAIYAIEQAGLVADPG